jgi:hypothetical protein
MAFGSKIGWSLNREGWLALHVESGAATQSSLCMHFAKLGVSPRWPGSSRPRCVLSSMRAAGR